MFDKDLLGCRGAALHSVDDDDVRPGLDCQHGIEISPGSPYLDVDGFFPIGNLPQFPDLDRQVVRPGPVRVAAGAALVDPFRQVAHLRNPGADLLAQQHAASPRFGALAHHHFNGIRPAQVIRVHPVAGWQQLVNQQFGVFTLFLCHAAVSGSSAGAHFGCATAQCFLCRRRQCAETHAGNRNGYF